MTNGTYQLIKQRALYALAHRHHEEYRQLVDAERWGFHGVHQVTTEAELLDALQTPMPFYTTPQEDH